MVPVLGIVVPCYNEQEVLLETNYRLKILIETMIRDGAISSKSSIFFVDDGSRDNTWNIINELSSNDPNVAGIKLTCNKGHQNALLCGLLNAPGDILISIDADLQDDLDVIPKMIKEYINGAHVVYGVRKSREVDTFFKKFTAESYYKLMSLMGVDLVFNHADYRLLSRTAIDSLSEYDEVNLFLRGLVRLIGYRSTLVEYDRAERFAGESKYPIGKMLALAWQGITSFSTAPLKLITTTGAVMSALSIGLGIWGLGTSLFTERALPGWTSIVVPMYFLGGVQLLSLGIIGEYISKIYIETKKRPRFHVEEKVGNAFSII